MVQWPEVKETTDLMAHLLAAQQRWLSRCKFEPAPTTSLWPDVPLSELDGFINRNHAEWTTYLETLKPEDFDSVISYQTTTGESYADQLLNILAHLINHGTHHRAQIGQYLKRAGASLPVTDYISYLRHQEN